jgi:hypothetical protein
MMTQNPDPVDAFYSFEGRIGRSIVHNDNWNAEFQSPLHHVGNRLFMVVNGNQGGKSVAEDVVDLCFRQWLHPVRSESF